MQTEITKVHEAWPANTCAFITREPTRSFGVHAHNYFEIEFALSGSIQHIVNGKSTVFAAGDIWFLNPSTTHLFYADAAHPELERYLLYFDPTVISSKVWRTIDILQLPFCLHTSEAEFSLLSSMFAHLASCAKNRLLERTEFVCRSLEWIILYLSEHHPVSDPTIAKLQPALVYIQSHYRENIAILDVADVVHYSVPHFSKLFHAYTGLSYREYLLRLRLSYAFLILFNPDIGVQKACFMSGFNTPEYFSRVFRKRFGISPEQHHLQQKNKASLGK